MAWTVPKTFVANSALTATELNMYLRDNMRELAVAQAVASSVHDLFLVRGPHKMRRRRPTDGLITTLEGTNSSEYGDLATDGPQVSVETGDKALVFLQAQAMNETANMSCRMSFAISGATERDPSDNTALCIMTDGSTSSTPNQMMAVYPVGELTPGINVFTAKYRNGGDTAVGTDALFQVRRIMVFPMT